MDHDHWSDAPSSGRTLPVLASFVAGVALGVFVTVLVVGDDAHGALDTVVLTTATEATTTTTSTVAPTMSTTSSVAPPPPPPPTPAPVPPDEVGGGSSDARTPDGPAEALDALARDLGTTKVTPVVDKSSGTFAVLTVSGRARLHEWQGDQWVEREVISTPAAVRDVATSDVTGDGTADFVVTMGSGAGGVFNNTSGGWGWTPFVHDAGRSEFADGLHLEGSRLRSEIELPDGGRAPAEWRWDGRRFTIR